MNKRTSTRIKSLSVIGAGVAAVVVGFTASNVVAAVPTLIAPAGVTADVPTQPMAPGEYPTNLAGETFGSAGQANSPENEPDLIAAVAENGAEGFVRKSELDEANGTNALKTFKTPEDAVHWQETAGAEDRRVAVYSVDGVTVVGEYLIVGYNTQMEMEKEYGEKKP